MPIRSMFFALLGFGVMALSPHSVRADEPKAGFDIVILPTEDFPDSELKKLVSAVANDTNLRMKIVLPLGTREWRPYQDRPQQYDPDIIKLIAIPVIERLRSHYGGKVYLILTARDIGPPDKSLNFAFSWHDQVQKISVISAARMLVDGTSKQAGPDLVQARLRKILLRSIAVQYYGLQRSANIEDVTYSPLMSVHDLDQMGVTLKIPQ